MTPATGTIAFRSTRRIPANEGTTRSAYAWTAGGTVGAGGAVGAIDVGGLGSRVRAIPTPTAIAVAMPSAATSARS